MYLFSYLILIRLPAATETFSDELRDEVTCLAASGDFFVTGHISGKNALEFNPGLRICIPEDPKFSHLLDPDPFKNGNIFS